MLAIKRYISTYPIGSFFALTIIISWLGPLVMYISRLAEGKAIRKLDGFVMFPLMIIGPPAANLIVTAFTEGKAGLQNLWTRMSTWKFSSKWYLISLLMPGALILTVLFVLNKFISHSFFPNFFPLGFLFAVPAGLLEEIGWSGYALEKIHLSRNIFKPAALLGLVWSIWHLPVIDFLGAASPHGKYWIPFFLSFSSILVAMRIIMAVTYSKTRSILLIQFMHIISTGCLVVLGPSKISPAQESLWYSLYAVLLWCVALLFLCLNRAGRNRFDHN